jgi:hypothetical protein
MVAVYGVRQRLSNDTQADATDPCVNCGTNPNLKNSTLANLNHMPGRGREVAVIVAFQKQLGKSGVYFRAGVNDTFLLPRKVPLTFPNRFASPAHIARSITGMTVASG